jgi:AraC family transcriptional regulator
LCGADTGAAIKNLRAPIIPPPPAICELADCVAAVSEWHCTGRKSGWQDEYPQHALIELPLTGMDLRAIRSRQVVVGTSTAVLHAGGKHFALASPSAQVRRSTSITVGVALLAEMAPDFLPGTVRTSTHTVLLRQRLHLNSHDRWARDELSLMLVDSVISDMRAQAGAPNAGLALPPGWARLADNLRQHMALAFDQALTLNQLAGACGVSAFHASRVFSRVTGLNLHRHLNRLRLREALFRLPDMPGRLTELALDLGFSSHSHFSSAFRAEFGSTPTAMARR